MRVLIHDYAGHPFQVQLSRELARRGHTVVHAFAGGLLTPRGALARKVEDPAGLSFCEVPMDPNYRRDKYRFLRRRQMELGYGRSLARVIADIGPDLVISGNTPSEPQWTAIRACQGRGIRFLSWVQDFYSVAVANLVRKKLPVLGHAIGLWYRWLDGKAFRASDAIVVITPDFVTVLESFGIPREKITVIPNWAPLDEVQPGPKRNAWSVQARLSEGFSFLYTGTLAMKHNPDLLLQLARRFKGTNGVRVVVVSEGPGADWLAQMVKAECLTNLTLLPFQEFTVMSEVLATGDVLVAILEPDAGVFSVPSKVLTYHCAARPILAAIPAQNLAARIIQDQGSGLTVDPTRPSHFVAAAEKLLQEADLRRKSAARARTYAEKNFEIQAITDRFEALFSSCWKGQSASPA